MQAASGYLDTTCWSLQKKSLRKKHLAPSFLFPARPPTKKLQVGPEERQWATAVLLLVQSRAAGSGRSGSNEAPPSALLHERQFNLVRYRQSKTGTGYTPAHTISIRDTAGKGSYFTSEETRLSSRNKAAQASTPSTPLDQTPVQWRPRPSHCYL